jgi:hypothetical protein
MKRPLIVLGCVFVLFVSAIFGHYYAPVADPSSTTFSAQLYESLRQKFAVAPAKSSTADLAFHAALAQQERLTLSTARPGVAAGAGAGGSLPSAASAPVAASASAVSTGLPLASSVSGNAALAPGSAPGSSGSPTASGAISGGSSSATGGVAGSASGGSSAISSRGASEGSAGATPMEQPESLVPPSAANSSPRADAPAGTPGGSVAGVGAGAVVPGGVTGSDESPAYLLDPTPPLHVASLTPAGDVSSGVLVDRAASTGVRPAWLAESSSDQLVSADAGPMVAAVGVPETSMTLVLLTAAFVGLGWWHRLRST